MDGNLKGNLNKTIKRSQLKKSKAKKYRESKKAKKEYFRNHVIPKLYQKLKQHTTDLECRITFIDCFKLRKSVA
jgi:hypothetical protein